MSQTPPDKPTIVVVGAGVIGLSTSIHLLRLFGSSHQIHLVASHFPTSPKHIDYTSPWAGAHHISVSNGGDMRLHEFDKKTFRVMEELIRREGQEKTGLYWSDQVEYRELAADQLPYASEGSDQLTLLSKYHPEFKVLPTSTLPSGCLHGVTFRTILIETPIYLLYLLEVFHSLGGLGSLTLSDVKDTNLFPTRGQLVIVRAPWVEKGITRLGPEGVYDYTIPRRKCGNVVLGGSADQNDWDPKPKPELTKRIKERCLALQRELLPLEKRENGTIDDLDVVELAVGLRPTRKGGIRIEVDQNDLEFEGKKIKVLHHYGHGGYGFQSSWGSAIVAVDLLAKTFSL